MDGGSHYDVIIVGGGPAGLTAGIYCARKGLKTLILERQMAGGRVNEAPFIENYPGFPDGIKGPELAMKMVEQARKVGVEIHEMEEVIDMKLDVYPKEIVTRKGRYTATAVILAMGAERKKSVIPDEERFLGRGLSYCAICDGFFFRGKKVAVIGSGDEAAEDALLLAGLASKVYLISHEEELTCEETLKTRMQEMKVEILEGYKVLKILGDQKISGIEIEDIRSGRRTILDVDGVFLALGSVPTTELARRAGVKLDGRGRIIVDENQMTSIEGVFAAGDCTSNAIFQISGAVGDGARAALSVFAYVRKRKKK
ncbi:MAG: NAD(P)/FAD-dependent oxidoreductase [Candidatus Baldrarchaeia archaeon]